VAHTRKPHVDEPASRRALLNLLAGSHVLGSVPRCVFVLQSASDEVTETRMVWTCCKSNDEELGPRTAWERHNGRVQPVRDFDWQAFNLPDAGKEVGITPAQVAVVFQDEQLRLAQSAAPKRLQDLTGRKKTLCCEALRVDGKFAEHLGEQGGQITWTP
jgi:hypothetical protein